MSRKTISIDEDLHDRLDDCKRENESWTEFVQRLFDAVDIEGRDGERTMRAPSDDDAGVPLDLEETFEEFHDEIAVLQEQLDGVLTEDHIDDIANATSAQTGTEVENRLASR